MSKHERMARIEGIDLDTGVFQMTLATEGEASDGHILPIAGGQIPERIPMQNSHINSPLETFGSITNPEKLLKDSPPRVRALGHIEMAGEEPGRAIRRDLAHMIDKGHVTGVSIRWDEVPGKTIRRVNLPGDHPHYVDDKAEGAKRYGLYFEEWVAREGSIVALGADKAALIGRAEETDGEVASFWRAMASDAELQSLPEEANPDERYIKLDFPEDESHEDYSPVSQAVSLAGLRVIARDTLKTGVSHADCINAIVDGSDADIEAVEIGEHVVFLPGPPAAIVRVALENVPVEDEIEVAAPEEMAHLCERLEALEAQVASALDDRAETDDSPASPQQEREDADPLPAIGLTQGLSEELREMFAESDARQDAFVRDLYHRARGRIPK